MERIVKAALRKNGIIATPAIERGRHHDIFAAFHRAGVDEFVDADQGFTTDAGRFVNREEAALIALRAEQLLPGREKVVAVSRQLYSEDVW